MIRYALACEHAHRFEAWFGGSDDYDAQAERGLVECPVCASRRVAKQIMAPAVATSRPLSSPAPDGGLREMMREAAVRVRRHVEDSFEHVGDRFAREARDIHEGRSEERGIYGEASPAEVRALREDGVAVAPLPAPIDDAKLN